jgi:hypothetical protein
MLLIDGTLEFLLYVSHNNIWFVSINFWLFMFLLIELNIIQLDFLIINQEGDYSDFLSYFLQAIFCPLLMVSNKYVCNTLNPHWCAFDVN